MDLEAQQITRASGAVIHFQIPAENREKLLNGADEIQLTLDHQDAISRFESRLEQSRPWV